MSLVKISGNASGTGTLTIAAPNTNTNRTLTLPDNTGTFLTSATTTGFPAGSVLQVVSTTKTNTFSTVGSTGTFVDITGLSVTITPSSASNKILIIGHSTVSTAATGNRAGFRIVRDSTAICIGDASGSRTRSTIGGQQIAATSEQDSVAFNFLDSPSTTSATTYKIQICGETGTTYYVNEPANPSTSGDQYASTSTITVMEIAA